ncbi:DUF4282 domain-containing protein [Brevibacterium album]|uniref:DUF4282 domain-containing protein n=1 Tax=Brevibacterium album TaxID=417948 RepID=UPI0004188640|nr:DUF4282 domain-containing protein [Brevibacterium album]
MSAQSPYSAQPAAASRPAAEPGFLRALFDLKFESFVTIRFAAVIYVLSIIVAALGYIGLVITSIGMAATGSALSSYAYGYSSGMGAMGVLMVVAAILLGWIPSLIQIVFTRVLIEFVVANVRTAQNTRKLAQRA